jgi:hypothetical protein
MELKKKVRWEKYEVRGDEVAEVFEKENERKRSGQGLVGRLLVAHNKHIIINFSLFSMLLHFL